MSITCCQGRVELICRMFTFRDRDQAATQSGISLSFDQSPPTTFPALATPIFTLFFFIK